MIHNPLQIIPVTITRAQYDKTLPWSSGAQGWFYNASQGGDLDISWGLVGPTYKPGSIETARILATVLDWHCVEITLEHRCDSKFIDPSDPCDPFEFTYLVIVEDLREIPVKAHELRKDLMDSLYVDSKLRIRPNFQAFMTVYNHPSSYKQLILTENQVPSIV